MNSFRYFKWNGVSPFDLDRDKLVEEFTQRLMSSGDVSEVLWDMQRNISHNTQGRHLTSLEELLHRTEQRKQIQMNRYNLNSVMDDIQKALDDVIVTERAGIQKYLDEINQRAQSKENELSSEMRQKLKKSIESKAAQNRKKLDNLPLDIGGRVKELSQYDFIDEDAKRKFINLMNMLKKRALDKYTRELGRAIENLDPGSLAELRKMSRGLNQMLEQRIRGQWSDFEGFMQEYGHFFGEKPPQSLDELIERFQDQMTQVQSLFNSLSREQQESLENILNNVLDPETMLEIARLGANLEYLNRGPHYQNRYPFFGEESLSYTEALKLMETFQKLDRLEGQIKEARFSHSLDSIDNRLLRELLGNEAAEELEAMRSITRHLEDSGYIRYENRNYELTPQGVRKIGEKALIAVFTRLKKDRIGGHRVTCKGAGGERLYDTKKYESGDDFDVHIEKTVMNALLRKVQTPVKLDIDDFEIFKQEQLTRSATVLMLDLSLSMHMHGNFQAAKIVAIALDTLIRSQYPRDSLYIVGFSSYARRMSRDDLTHVNWDNLDPYTNMQHGLSLARKLLSKDTNANKQIMLISDGEPTAHFENGRVFFQYPPSLRTLRSTLKEVSDCTHSGVVINTFMLKSEGSPEAFVNQVARLNRGRVFATTADKLGEYIIIDYLSSKRQKAAI
jgi:uncharacterized protein with von Willebrand factor type A (vWA) domain